MSEIEAAELARFLEIARDPNQYTSASMAILSLLDALEKARGENSTLQSQKDKWYRQAKAHRAGYKRAESAIAERDAARALLGEALPWVGHMSDNPDIGLRARIAAELEPKP